MEFLELYAFFHEHFPKFEKNQILLHKFNHQFIETTYLFTVQSIPIDDTILGIIKDLLTQRELVYYESVLVITLNITTFWDPWMVKFMGSVK